MPQPRTPAAVRAQTVGWLGGLVGGGGRRELGQLYARLGELKEALAHERSLRVAVEVEKERYREELESLSDSLTSTQRTSDDRRQSER